MQRNATRYRRGRSGSAPAPFQEDAMPKIDMDKFEQITTELVAYGKAMRHAHGPTFDAMASHVDELLRKRCRALGLTEDEIARIEQEKSPPRKAVDQQIADEVKQTMLALFADKPRR
jgi:hypothetical protein